MKKLIKIVWMLIIVISINTVAKAQYGNVSGMDQNVNYGIATARGTGLFELSVQQQTNGDIVYANLDKALFANTAEALTVFRGDLPGLTRRNLMDLQGYEIKKQLGTFEASNRARYDLKIYLVSTEAEARDFWTKLDDGYVILGDTKISYCKPLNSPNYRFQPFWYAVLTDKQTGRSMLLRANCGNPLHLAGTGTFNETVVTTNSVATNTPGVMVNNNIYAVQPNPALQRQAEMNTDIRQDVPKKKSWFKRNAAWVVPVAAVIVGGTAYMLLKKNNGNGNNNHDPNWQPPSGTPWTDGGSGDGPSW